MRHIFYLLFVLLHPLSVQTFCTAQLRASHSSLVEKYENALQEKCELAEILKGDQCSLIQALEYIEDLHEIRIEFDANVQRKIAKINVRLAADDLTVAQAIFIFFEPHGLKISYADETLQITLKEAT
jgi:DUF1009 family protein